MAVAIAGCDKGACVAPLLFVWLRHCMAADAAAPLQSEVAHLALGQRGVSPRPSAHPGAPEITTIYY